MKIVLLQPMRFEEAQTITRYLLDNRVVVFDLHECQVEEAVNIVNFVSGAIFALNGSIQKINDRGAIFRSGSAISKPGKRIARQFK